MDSLYPEGNGGGQGCESYDLAALMYLKRCEIPNARKPILVFTGDEGIYKMIDQEQAERVVGEKLWRSCTTQNNGID